MEDYIQTTEQAEVFIRDKMYDMPQDSVGVFIPSYERFPENTFYVAKNSKTIDEKSRKLYWDENKKLSAKNKVSKILFDNAPYQIAFQLQKNNHEISSVKNNPDWIDMTVSIHAKPPTNGINEVDGWRDLYPDKVSDLLGYSLTPLFEAHANNGV
jgi:hypothetical protein